MSEPPADPPAERPDPLASRQTTTPQGTAERSLDSGPRPRGLVGLLVWPLQALLLAMVNLAAGLVEGLVRALIPGGQDPASGGTDEPDDDPGSDTARPS